MSAGKYLVGGRYLANNGTTYRIRIQPETVAAFNANPPAPVTGTGSVRVGGGNRRIGIKARSVTGRWTSTAPDGYDDFGIIRIPILTPTAWNALALGTEITYLGESLTIIGISPERVR